jgi:hypothetical protein
MAFATSFARKEFIELSDKFIMVNSENDEQPQSVDYQPDGHYTPRLLFLGKRITTTTTGC